MKGQLTIEYLISFVIFIGLIAYVYFSYSANIPKFIQEVGREAVRSEAYQLSELLVNNPGEPQDWQTVPTANIKRIGLSDERYNKTNLISKAKIDELDIRFDCNNLNEYNDLMSKLGANRNFSFMIFGINLDNGIRTPLFTCDSPVYIGPINITVQRIAAFYDSSTINTTEIIIQM